MGFNHIPHVVFVCLSHATALTNQSFRRQVTYLVREGFPVTLITNAWDYKLPFQAERFHVHRITLTSRLIKQSLTERIKKRRDKERICSSQWQPLAQTVPFSNDSLFAEWASFVPNLEFAARVLKRVILDLGKELERSNTVVWGYERPGAMAAYVVAKALRLPLVTSFEGTVLYPWLKQKGNFLTFLRFPTDFLATSIPADWIVMTNDGTHGDRVLRMLGHSRGKILFVPNGIALEELSKVRPLSKETIGVSSDEFLFVVVSRLSSWKRVDRALYAAAALRSMGHKFRLVIVGDGPERERLETLSEMLSLSDMLRFEGALPNDQALRIIASADMLWSFCDHSNLTNSVQEAIGLGVPVLTIADGSMDGYTQWPGIFCVPLSDRFAEEAAYTVPLAIARAKDLDPPEKVPTWEDRGREIAERLRELFASQREQFIV